jgi:phage terminase small subunit
MPVSEPLRAFFNERIEMSRKPRKLTPKQERFCYEFVRSGNATDAYRQAYDASRMAPGTIHNRACRLRKESKVGARILELQSRKAEVVEQMFRIDVDRVANELAAIGFANMQDYVSIDDDGNASVDLSNVDRRQFAAIAEITIEDIETGQRVGKRTRFKLADKKGALVELGKHLGMFSQNAPPMFDQIEASAEEFDRKLDRLIREFEDT